MSKNFYKFKELQQQQQERANRLQQKNLRTLTSTNKPSAEHQPTAVKDKFHPNNIHNIPKKALTRDKMKDQERIKLQIKMKAALVRQKDQSVGMISFDRVRSMYPAKLNDDVSHP